MTEHNHADLILLHEEMFKNIQKSIDMLIKVDQERNGRYDKHVNESGEYRQKLVDVCAEVDNIRKGHQEIRGYGITIIALILAWAASSIWWASAVNKQVEINTQRLNLIEDTHRRGDGAGKIAVNL
jgi:hypothetical protein